jgi:hypothetical protein
MGFFKKFIPKEIRKPVAKALDKFVPNELKPALPFIAAATPFLLPTTGIFSSNLMRALASGSANVASQLALDPEGDLNDLSILLAAGSGALTGPKTASNLRSGIESGIPAEAAMARGPAELGMTTRGTGFFQGAENIGREGLASLSDYMTGARDTLANIGKDPGSLFDAGVKGARFPELTAAAKASAPIVAQGTGDLAYATASKAMREFEEMQAEELRQAGLSETEMMLARRNAITEAMTDALFDEEDINSTLDELGLLDFAQGGIASLKDGGMLDFGGREMDLRGGGFVPIGKKEKADDVPARLSKNEFVMTADAVRAAGGGSVNKGAQRMYNLMNNLEARA